MLVEYTNRSQTDQLLAVHLQQPLRIGAAFFYRQRAEHEVRHIAPRPPAACQLPVEPDALPITTLKTVALVRVAMDQADGRRLRPLEGSQLIEGMAEQLWRLVHPTG
ncbi:hypothetical protein D3C79_869550 [compost metagenome]